MNNTQFAKCVVFINCGVPLALLAWDASQNHLGASPTQHALHITGKLALIILCLSLLITPLRKISGWNVLITFRKTLGNYAFFYACLHFLIYFIFDRSRNVSSTFSEIWNRSYLMMGSLALVTMLPLAITSTKGMMKRLGGKRWQALHRLVYASAVCAVVHYYLQGKFPEAQSKLFIAIVTVLLGYRLVAFLTKKVPRQEPRGFELR